jgi:hypothetical protein
MVGEEEDLVTALLAVEGVAGAEVESLGSGPGTLRLQLAPDSDEVAVAGAVNRLLRARFGLAVDADRVRVFEQTGRPGLAGRLERSPDDDRASRPDRTSTTERATSVRPPSPFPPLLPPPVPADEMRLVDDRPVVRSSSSFVEVDSIPESAGPTAESGEDAAARVHMVRPGRLAIQRVQLVSAGLGVAVTVTLGLDGTTYAGEAEGSATPGGVHRSVAVATLRAVELLVDGAARFEVEHVELTRLGADQTVVVLVTMLTGRATQRLTGASVVREDVRQAVIRAVLAAINRRLEVMLEEQHPEDS